MPDTPDWDLLQSLHAVLEAGSFSAAAKIRHLTQPTLGRQVDALVANAMLTDAHAPLTAGQNLAVASLGVYAAAALFALTWKVPVSQSSTVPP